MSDQPNTRLGHSEPVRPSDLPWPALMLVLGVAIFAIVINAWKHDVFGLSMAICGAVVLVAVLLLGKRRGLSDDR